MKSSRGTQFRQWATEWLRDYMVKGFVLDDEHLAEPGGIYKIAEDQSRFKKLMVGECDQCG
ncbi:MAG: virulence RhuM family protein [Planctomycetia bacterium]|nr:virulence RhuM family protein [Planctomycetia bacterium]